VRSPNDECADGRTVLEGRWLHDSLVDVVTQSDALQLAPAAAAAALLSPLRASAARPCAARGAALLGGGGALAGAAGATMPSTSRAPTYVYEGEVRGRERHGVGRLRLLSAAPPHRWAEEESACPIDRDESAMPVTLSRRDGGRSSRATLSVILTRGCMTVTLSRRDALSS